MKPEMNAVVGEKRGTDAQRFRPPGTTAVEPPAEPSAPVGEEKEESDCEQMPGPGHERGRVGETEPWTVELVARATELVA